MRPTPRVAETVRTLTATSVAVLLLWPAAAAGQLATDPYPAIAAAGWPGSQPSCLARHWPFGPRDPDAPDRYVGWGHPLEGTSWRNRPFHLGWSVGLGDNVDGGGFNESVAGSPHKDDTNPDPDHMDAGEATVFSIVPEFSFELMAVLATAGILFAFTIGRKRGGRRKAERGSSKKTLSE